MLYHFLYPLYTQFSFFNVFRYLTFRSVGSAVTAFLILFMLEPFFIRWLQNRQIGQVVRSDGPESHLSKRGVPTMGGVLILISIFLSTLLWANLLHGVIWVCLGLTLLYGLIGSIDDWKKVTKSSSEGLSARGKLILQVSGASLVGLFLYLHPDYDGILSLPFFKGIQPDLGWWYIPFAVAVIVGASNAVNLTDGLDGLATGTVMISAVVYFIFAYAAGNVLMADYLRIPHVLGAGEVAVFCGTIFGSCLGFLWFNTYPARVFMGDVGSLALGGALGTVSVIIKQEILLAIVGGIFVMEALSVIIQVGYFKISGGKRIFLMAPFHHHFEKKGWAEPKVVVRFWIISIILGLMALATLKLR
ncbi:MAG: phospho-N-acetylmuramoyl-pentapeptide-transferase [Candidatus Electrothrix sp. AR3]|nr:phospho-N-acetylmuramoyl-pentapeptide-transferase [Candidatus Electrothrix sp. AR3]